MQLPAASESISPGEGRSSVHRSCQPQTLAQLKYTAAPGVESTGQKFPVWNTYFCLSLLEPQSPRHNLNYASQTFVFVNSFQGTTLEICAGSGVHQPGIRSKLHNNQYNNEAYLTFLLQQSHSQSIFKSLQGSQQGNRLGKSTMWELRIAVWPSTNSRMAQTSLTAASFLTLGEARHSSWSCLLSDTEPSAVHGQLWVNSGVEWCHSRKLPALSRYEVTEY